MNAYYFSYQPNKMFCVFSFTTKIFLFAISISLLGQVRDCLTFPKKQYDFRIFSIMDIVKACLGDNYI